MGPFAGLLIDLENYSATTKILEISDVPFLETNSIESVVASIVTK